MVLLYKFEVLEKENSKIHRNSIASDNSYKNLLGVINKKAYNERCYKIIESTFFILVGNPAYVIA